MWRQCFKEKKALSRSSFSLLWRVRNTNFSTLNHRSLIKKTCRYLWELFKHTSASLMNFSSFIGFFNRNQKTSFEKKREEAGMNFLTFYHGKNFVSIRIHQIFNTIFFLPLFYAVNESLFFLFDRLFRYHEKKEKKMSLKWENEFFNYKSNCLEKAEQTLSTTL